MARIDLLIHVSSPQAPSLMTGQSAQETKRETAWTIKETPGVRLVSVKPRNEVRINSFKG